MVDIPTKEGIAGGLGGFLASQISPPKTFVGTAFGFVGATIGAIPGSVFGPGGAFVGGFLGQLDGQRQGDRLAADYADA